MLNDLYIRQVDDTFGAEFADTVDETIKQAEGFVSKGVPYTEASTETEANLIKDGADEILIRLCLVAFHAQYGGWDDTFDFFLDEPFESVSDGQGALIAWVKAGNWL